MLSQLQGQPGARTAKTVAHRLITRGGWIPDVLPSGKYIDGANSRDPGNTPEVTRLRAGMLMGKCTGTTGDATAPTSGYYAPSIIDVLASAVAAAATSLTVSAAGAVEIVRRFGASGTFNLTGPGSAAGVVVTEVVTYSAVNTTTGVVTVTALTNNFIAGSFVQPQDGSEDILTFIPNGYPLPVTEFDGTAVTAQEFPEVPINCFVDSSQILPVWPSDTSLRAYIVSRLNRPGGGQFQFSHLY
jgi:hypothetical protein